MKIQQESSTERIWVCSWGATMTMIDFYRVIKETEKQIVLREIKSEERDTGFLCGYASPVVEDVKDEEGKYVEVRCTKYEEGAFSKKCGYSKYFHPWDGKEKFFNHCD